ncbi:Butyryl-CoA dehydrogenase [Actinokineospora spheciospongiae]|uniref:Butyryl-CoA dehydrogenase n=1 Tax=Actinokineospora spheciospongiae TaxID=909613 RepID=W7J4E1_9PSEU|nr:acyl-CoA dehydrogenase family protein [Actinokineospora spheciospongiae]EWC63882.1 Butyryl-CoA dehydrogenase [Actinokineospora spheciospongiae]
MDHAAFAESARAGAAAWDAGAGLPAEVVRSVADAGFLAADLPVEHGGRGWSATEVGELCASLGGVCSALRALVTVQGMVAAAVLRWGDRGQRAAWLPALAGGDRLAAFAATETGAGTDLSAVDTEISATPGGLRVRGRKVWVTFGQSADVFLVLARSGGGLRTALVEADRPGVTVEPVTGQLGMRAARIANVRFDDVTIPAANAIAPPGYGLSHVAGTALDHGRFTVAWGCVGIAESCLDHTATHVGTRTQGGARLADHDAVRALLGRCLAEARAARAVCAHAAALRERGEPAAIAETVLAKYTASRAATAVSEHAVRLHGSAGIAPDSTVGRLHRDAVVMRIIEGPDEVAERHLGDHALRRRR